MNKFFDPLPSHYSRVVVVAAVDRPEEVVITRLVLIAVTLPICPLVIKSKRWPLDTPPSPLSTLSGPTKPKVIQTFYDRTNVEFTRGHPLSEVRAFCF